MKLNIDVTDVMGECNLTLNITDVTDDCVRSEICLQRTAEIGNLVITEKR